MGTFHAATATDSGVEGGGRRNTFREFIAFIAFIADKLNISYANAMRTIDRLVPAKNDVTVAEEVLPRLRSYLEQHPDVDKIGMLVSDEHGDEQLTLPRSAVELLARVLAHMAAGQGVSVVPAHAELTTQQAAGLLNVSRPFLIGLLDAGEIEYRTVGKHRRVKAESLLAYRAADDSSRRTAADELSALTQEMGLL